MLQSIDHWPCHNPAELKAVETNSMIHKWINKECLILISAEILLTLGFNYKINLNKKCMQVDCCSVCLRVKAQVFSPVNLVFLANYTHAPCTSKNDKRCNLCQPDRCSEACRSVREMSVRHTLYTPIHSWV